MTAARRKILFYTHSMAGGGAERVWALLASGFARRGHETMLVVDYEASQNIPYIDPSVKLITLGRGHLASTRALAKLLKSTKPDISLSALGVSNLKHLAAAIMAGRRDRAVLSYHGFFESEPQRLSRLAYLSTPLTTRLAARTICVSDELKTYLFDVWGADRRKTLRIHNPVFNGRTGPPPTRDDLAGRSPLVLASGRFIAEKNFSGLLRAFAMLSRKDARLIILGDGDGRASLIAQVKALGLEARVDLPGYVDEPWTLYDQAACFVVSSRRESFSLVVVEALAHGLPVIATDSGGPTEILEKGSFGSIVPYDDDRAMAVAIEAALADPGDPASRVRRAQIFSLDRGLDHYERMIDDLARELGLPAAVAEPAALARA